MARTPSHAVYRSSQPREHKGIRNVPLPFEGHTPRGLPSIDRLTRMRGHAHCLPVPRSAVHHTFHSLDSVGWTGPAFVVRATVQRLPPPHAENRYVSVSGGVFFTCLLRCGESLAVAHRANSLFTGDINIDCCGWDCLLA